MKAILTLKLDNGIVRSSDVAKYLHFSRPSVSCAIRSLTEGGFLMMDEHKNIILTERGQEAAKEVYERNRVIKEALVFIGVEPEIAEEDACRIEHDMSRQSFDMLKKLWEKYMIKTTVKIEGMMCGMCEAHVCDAIRKAVPSAKKVSASRSKREATFLTEDAVDGEQLKAAINATGYTCLGMESVPNEKKGLFRR